MGTSPPAGTAVRHPRKATTFVVARGSGYAAGKNTDSYTIADITPTILQSLGVALPTDLDGKPLAKEAPGFVGSVDLGFFGS